MTTPGTLPLGPGAVKGFLRNLTRAVIHAPHPSEAGPAHLRPPRPPASGFPVPPGTTRLKVPVPRGKVKRGLGLLRSGLARLVVARRGRQGTARRGEACRGTLSLGAVRQSLAGVGMVAVGSAHLGAWNIPGILVSGMFTHPPKMAGLVRQGWLRQHTAWQAGVASRG